MDPKFVSEVRRIQLLGDSLFGEIFHLILFRVWVFVSNMFVVIISTIAFIFILSLIHGNIYENHEYDERKRREESE